MQYSDLERKATDRNGRLLPVTSAPHRPPEYFWTLTCTRCTQFSQQSPRLRTMHWCTATVRCIHVGICITVHYYNVFNTTVAIRIPNIMQNTQYNADEHDHVSLDMVTNKEHSITLDSSAWDKKMAKKLAIFSLTAIKHVKCIKLLVLPRK